MIVTQKIFEKKWGAAGRKMTIKTMEEGEIAEPAMCEEYAFSVKVKTDCELSHVK
jgi:hypothetical protein